MLDIENIVHDIMGNLVDKSKGHDSIDYFELLKEIFDILNESG